MNEILFEKFTKGEPVHMDDLRAGLKNYDKLDSSKITTQRKSFRSGQSASGHSDRQTVLSRTISPTVNRSYFSREKKNRQTAKII